jgi:aryl sulfotransferase
MTASPAIAWPERTRELHNFAMDSTRWDRFKFRDGDIVIGTWGKSGTTWTQQIVGQLIFNGATDIPVADIAPWFELRFVPLDDLVAAVEAQKHRRFVKTHLPADALIISPQARYIYLARDGRDVIWSWYNHLVCMTDEFYTAFNETPGLVGPPIERPSIGVREYFHEWLDHDAAPAWPYWPNVQAWWDVRQLPNVMLLHFNNLKADLPGQIRRIAAFLDIEIDETLLPTIVEHCSFGYMKSHAASISERFGDVFIGGIDKFFHKGTNGRWRDVLTSDDIEKYEAKARANLSADCSHWLATGELP